MKEVLSLFHLSEAHRQKKEILATEEIEQENMWAFCLKNDLHYN